VRQRRRHALGASVGMLRRFIGGRIVRSAGSAADRRVQTSRKRARWYPADASKSRQVRKHARRRIRGYSERLRQFTDGHERIVFGIDHILQRRQARGV
jgi:hypothetical protein